ncbi:MAG: deoxyribodipyrimidine photo-lyase [Myxococcales bacterium]|nr:deoxyribodipyrimidine photo-lyase [Myxococcales bacterium]
MEHQNRTNDRAPMTKKKPPAPPLDAAALAAARILCAHDAPARRGQYVLYWLRGLRRAEDNLAFDHAVTRANALGLPLVVYESLDVRYPYASARMHTFVLESAIGRRAAVESRGAAYALHLPRTADEAREGRVVSKLAARAALVVTDWQPPAGPLGAFFRRTAAKIGADANVRVECVDDTVGVPMSLFADKHEIGARTIRPKVHKVLDASLVASDEPTVISQRIRSFDWPFEPVDPTADSIAKLVASCAIDHSVAPVTATRGTRKEARSRLERFVAARLRSYDSARNDMGGVGSSELSAYLHFGVLSGRSVARAARAAAAPIEARESFVEELIVRRALAFNHVMTTPCEGDGAHHRYAGAVPEWARKTLGAHAADARSTHTFKDWESARTTDPLWNAAQRELLRDGVIHPYARMLWGKVALTLAPSPEVAFEWLVALNDKWALDGRDPNTYTNIAWCFGLHDHPYPERAVFGTVRCMTSKSARTKWDTRAYERRVLTPSSPEASALRSAQAAGDGPTLPA